MNVTFPLRYLAVTTVALLFIFGNGVVAHAATSALWGTNGELWSPDSRLPDYSYAGYKSGEEAIPQYTNRIDITQYGAVANDNRDDSGAVSRAIAAAPPNSAIYFPPGTWYIAQEIDIRKSNIALVGAGQDQTTLYFPKDLHEVNGESKAYIRPTFSRYSWSDEFIKFGGDNPLALIGRVTQRADRGTNRLVLSSTAGITVGQRVRFIMKNTGNVLNTHLHEGIDGASKNRDWLMVDHVSRVTAVSGNTITLERPLPTNVELTMSPEVHRFQPTVHDVGIQDLTIQFADTYYDWHHGELGNNALKFTGVSDCWVNNVTFYNVDTGIFGSSRFCTYNNLTFDAWSNRSRTKFSNGQPSKQTGHYGLQMGRSKDSLISNIEFKVVMVHDVSLSGYASGNVFANMNHVDGVFDFHRNSAFENLFTNIDIGGGWRFWWQGGNDIGPHMAARNTYWNITADRNQKTHYDLRSNGGKYEFGPDQTNFVGYKTGESRITGSSAYSNKGKWVEPGVVTPSNIHQAQFNKRTGNEHPAYGGVGGTGRIVPGLGGGLSAEPVIPERANPRENLANGTSFSRSSNNFDVDGPVRRLFDGCIQSGELWCGSGSGSSNTIWVEYDLGELYDLGNARLYGDALRRWVSKEWTLEYKRNSSDAWQQVGNATPARFNDWSLKFVGVEARYIKLTVTGDDNGTVQAREFEIFGVSVRTASLTGGTSTDGGSSNQTTGGTTSNTPAASPINLINAHTYSDDSGNFFPTRPATGLFDNCYGDTDIDCMPGNEGIDSFWVEFDFGELYTLTSARLHGDTRGTWVSTSWTLQYKEEEDDIWRNLFDRVDAYMNAWSERTINFKEARYVRVIVYGDSQIHRTQARELQVFALSGPTTGTRNTISGGSSGGTTSSGSISGGITGSSTSSGTTSGEGALTTGSTSPCSLSNPCTNMPDNPSTSSGSGTTSTSSPGSTSLGSSSPEVITAPGIPDDQVIHLSQLANGSTYTRHSNNLDVDTTISRLWDGCTSAGVLNCAPGTMTADSFWVEYDLGDAYNLFVARLFGDVDGTWISNSWTLQAKMNQDDPWNTVVSRKDARFNDWSSENLSHIARFVRLTVYGDTTLHRTQVREFELHGALQDDPVVACCIPLPAPVSETEVILYPEADAYVRGGSYAHREFGKENLMVVRTTPGNDSYTRYGFVRFNLSGITGTVTSAEFVMYPTSLTSDTGTDYSIYHSADDSWKESTINWKNRPARGEKIATEHAVEDTLTTFDITSFVESEIAEDGILTIQIVENNNVWTRVTDSDHWNTENWPRLVLKVIE